MFFFDSFGLFLISSNVRVLGAELRLHPFLITILLSLWHLQFTIFLYLYGPGSLGTAFRKVLTRITDPTLVVVCVISQKKFRPAGSVQFFPRRRGLQIM